MMKQINTHQQILFLIMFFALMVLFFGACSLVSDDASDQSIPLAQNTSVPDVAIDSPEKEVNTTQFTLALSEGQAQPYTNDGVQQSTGVPLSNEEIASIFARLSLLIPEPDDQLDFKFPDALIPPPRTGKTVDNPFPLPESVSPPTIETGPLEVLRYAPEGEIPIAPFVSITFNQPMVPLTTITDLSSNEVPVIIEPPLTGTWRWLGTKTLNFQYASDLVDRIPMATEYQVTVPSGTQSSNGSILSESLRFSFSTPPPTVITTHPNYDPQPLDPVIFIGFDQLIDPQSVLTSIKVTADGNKIKVRLATLEEIAADKTVSAIVAKANAGRWMAFKSTSLLPPDSSIEIKIGPGTPSAEGPLVTKTSQNFSFETYAPLKIVDYGCWGYNEECRPLMAFNIEFNNVIDAENYDENMLQISPDLPGASVNIFGNHIQISGVSQGQTTYRVRVNGDIQDIFGQTLGQDQQLKFKVGSSEPYLVGPDQNFITLDPSSQHPGLSLYTINYNKLDVKIFAVQPTDWPDFLTYLQQYQRTDQHQDPPGKLVLDEVQNFEVSTDVLTNINIELGSLMDGDFGHFIIIVKPHQTIFEEENYWETIQTWVQVTNIGLDAFSDHSEMIVWTTNLGDGSPLSGASISSNSNKINTNSDQNGIARFDLPSSSLSYLVARAGSDQAILPRSTYFWDDAGWISRTMDDTLRWYVFDDRQMYRPGEEVHIKGWLRLIGAGQTGDVGLVGKDLTSINYQLIGPQGNQIISDQADVNVLGGFDFVFTLPENTNLGYAQLQLNTEGSIANINNTQHHHTFQIQEFRRPEFEVNARNESTGPYFAGDHAIVAVDAKYYAGGPLPNAETTWWVTSSPTNYQPPNWPNFSFGTWIPWWNFYQPDFEEISGTTYTGKTDSGGTHFLRLDFPSEGQVQPISILSEATVMDVNRQAWSSTTSLMVHPANLYVGLRSDRYFVDRGTPLDIDIIVTDLDGNPISDRPITVEAARLQWKSQGGWHLEEVDIQTCHNGSESQPVSCTFETPIGGRYKITATIIDENGRKNQSQFTRWVSGGQQPPSRDVEQETVTLIPDKQIYLPGDIAEILVEPPFTPAEGILTVSRSGIIHTERFTIEQGTHTLYIPIHDAYIPNLNIQVDVVGAVLRTDDSGEIAANIPPRPAYATGQLNLSIPPLARTLTLDAALHDKELEPGGSTTLSVTVKNAGGQPVADAELAVVVVDEAILALTQYAQINPIDAFYTQRSADLSSVYGRASIILSDPLALAENESLIQSTTIAGKGLIQEEAAMDMLASAPEAASEMRMAEGDTADANPIRIRSDFNPLAIFMAEVHTDNKGLATVDIKLPDNLTRYRVMVVAVDNSGKQFGAVESNLTARLPLMVRPSAPRFLNFGDQFDLPVVLQNQTDQALEVDIVIDVTNIILTDFSGLRVTVPANDRVEVRFPATTDMAGIARFQIAAISGNSSDASTVEIPVYTPATTEAFATYGVIDEGAIVQPIAQPTNVFPQFGGLEISTSSTALQSLTDAVLYLSAYPYECTEQLSSRILGIAALRDVLTSFEADGLPSPEELESSVQRDIERLNGIQNWDGGFPYWRRGQESIPYNTIHVAHALQRAALKGFDIPESMLQNSLAYLQNIESHYPHWYSLSTRQTLSAYALYVRHLMGDRNVHKARTLLNDSGIENLSLDAIGWIWGVLIDDPTSGDELLDIRTHINNRVVELAGEANFTIGYDDQTYLLLSSSRRTDAILLDALIADNPSHDLIPKLVNGLLSHRTKGRWGNTQENVFVLLALDRYFNTYEAQTPDFVARIWLGDTYAGEHAYKGYTTERNQTKIPMNYFVNDIQQQDLILSKEGIGRLYYRLGLSYAPTNLNLEPLDMGFVVMRTYEAVDNPKDVYQDNDGVWHIKAGSRVRVHLTMVADNRRYHVALIDPLPAGLEIINPALAVSGSIPQDPESSDYRYGWWWWGTWYEHQNMRDERAEAFTSLLWDGIYEYTYITLATTPGTFITPPAKAEEMYSPEVFGRSGSDLVIVE
ncbi:MAG: hypothetical protein IMY76_04005 [Chloroflexi bacterium]|nr:hypothetical protein [Chloroflexota bacterium]